MKTSIGLRVLVLLAAAGCGRTSLPPAACLLAYAPASLDFGEVAPPGATSLSVSLVNRGGEVCSIHDVTLAPGSDAGFVLPGGPARLELWPRQRAAVTVTFAPTEVAIPLARKGTLLFQTSDKSQLRVEVPLTARIKSNCKIAVSPSAVDFGHVMLDSAATRNVDIVNIGTDQCQIANIAIGSGSDPQFALATTPFPGLTIARGARAQIPVTFHAVDAKAPHHRTGTLVFQSTDPGTPSASVPLSAEIDIGCELTISPAALSFGNVILNTTVSAPVTLGNDGSADCKVSGIKLGMGTDPAFALAAAQPTAFTVAPGATRDIPISFTASDSAPPHLKTGTLVFQTGNPRAPDGVVPLSAYVNTACVEASQWIYTVDQVAMFSKFDPATLTFTDIGTLKCPTSSTPNSMAVDQNAVAWVAYNDGNLFQVDTSNAQCQATTFKPNQHGLLQFGMGFVFDPMTGNDTLFIAGGASTGVTQSTLATISFPQLVVNTIGPVDGLPELSGTGDGTLWGFIPSIASSSGKATLMQIDPATGATLKSFPYPQLSSGSNWAMKFWGGSFWIFLGQSIFEAKRAAPQTVTTAIANSGRSIVGAGVSTCAPLH